MRVDAFLDVNKEEKIAKFLGFGEYIGDKVPDEKTKLRYHTSWSSIIIKKRLK